MFIDRYFPGRKRVQIVTNWKEGFLDSRIELNWANLHVRRVTLWDRRPLFAIYRVVFSACRSLPLLSLTHCAHRWSLARPPFIMGRGGNIKFLSWTFNGGSQFALGFPGKTPSRNRNRTLTIDQPLEHTRDWGKSQPPGSGSKILKTRNGKKPTRNREIYSNVL